jgi:hypothetical protein
MRGVSHEWDVATPSVVSIDAVETQTSEVQQSRAQTQQQQQPHYRLAAPMGSQDTIQDSDRRVKYGSRSAQATSFGGAGAPSVRIRHPSQPMLQVIDVDDETAITSDDPAPFTQRASSMSVPRFGSRSRQVSFETTIESDEEQSSIALLSPTTCADGESEGEEKRVRRRAHLTSHPHGTLLLAPRNSVCFYRLWMLLGHNTGRLAMPIPFHTLFLSLNVSNMYFLK